MQSLVVIDAIFISPHVCLKIVATHEDWQALRENTGKAVRLIPVRDIHHSMLLVVAYYDVAIFEFLTRQQFDILCLEHMENIVRLTGELDSFEPTETIAKLMFGLFEDNEPVDLGDEDEE